MGFQRDNRIGNHAGKAEADAQHQNKTNQREHTINYLQAADRCKYIVIRHAHADNPARALHSGIGNNDLSIGAVCQEDTMTGFQHFIKAAANAGQILSLAADLFFAAVAQNNAVFIRDKGLTGLTMVFNLLGHGIHYSQINIRAHGTEVLPILFERCHCRYDHLAGILVHVRFCIDQLACLLGIIVPGTGARVERPRALVLGTIGSKITILGTDIQIQNFRVGSAQRQ